MRTGIDKSTQLQYDFKITGTLDFYILFSVQPESKANQRTQNICIYNRSRLSLKHFVAGIFCLLSDEHFRESLCIFEKVCKSALCYLFNASYIYFFADGNLAWKTEIQQIQLISAHQKIANVFILGIHCRCYSFDCKCTSTKQA